jgi:hypothetical protein
MIIPGSHHKRRSRSYRTDSSNVRRGGQPGESRKRGGKRGHRSYI